MALEFAALLGNALAHRVSHLSVSFSLNCNACRVAEQFREETSVVAYYDPGVSGTIFQICEKAWEFHGSISRWSEIPFE